MSTLAKKGDNHKVTYGKRLYLPNGLIVRNSKMEKGYAISGFISTIPVFISIVGTGPAALANAISGDAFWLTSLAVGSVSFAIAKSFNRASHFSTIRGRMMKPIKSDSSQKSAIRHHVATVPVILDIKGKETARGSIGSIAITEDNQRKKSWESYIPVHETMAPTHMLTETIIGQGKTQYIQRSWKESPLYAWDIVFEQSKRLSDHRKQKLQETSDAG